jgi:hypothetical protein
MFNYPIILKSETFYSKIGVTPDASASDIRDGIQEIKSNYTSHKVEIQDKISKVMSTVPELHISREVLKSLKKEMMDAKNNDLKELDEKYRKALDDVLQNEKKAVDHDPYFKKYEVELNEINKKISDLSLISLEKEADRIKYDMATPPCALIKISEYKPLLFNDSRTFLHNIRTSISCFLEELSMECFHPTDLTRRNFYSDYNRNSLLDQEE